MGKTYKLNRFFDPRLYKDIPMFIILFLILFIVNRISKENEGISFYLFGIFLFSVLSVFGRRREATKELFIDVDTFKFEERKALQPVSKGFFLRTRGVWYWVKVSYTVTDLKNVELCQNGFEALFDVGHIKFSGKTEFTAKKHLERIKPKDTFVIYGIKNFALFKSDFGRNVK